MKLFTKEIDKKLFEQYLKGNDLAAQNVVCKIFNPFGRGTWYVLNSDPEDPDYLWCIVDLHTVEVGSVLRSEMEGIKVPPFGLGLERDTSYRERNALEVYKELKEAKPYGGGGAIENIDLFEFYEKQPKELRAVTKKWEEKFMEGESLDYKDTEKFLKEVESKGYTFDYGLDNEPYNLRKKGTKGNPEFKKGGMLNFIQVKGVAKKGLDKVKGWKHRKK